MVLISGSLPRDAEVKAIGTSMLITFSLPVNYTVKDEQKTDWYNVQYWAKENSKLGQYLLKGTRVNVAGELRTEKYTNKQGVDVTKTVIKADDIKMIGGGKGESSTPTAQASAPKRTAGWASYGGEDEIPPF
jgi:single-strand DNA-binding protein